MDRAASSPPIDLARGDGRRLPAAPGGRRRESKERSMTASHLGVRIEETDGPSELVPEGLLPVQFVELLQRPAERTPELRLMVAVLEDALRTFCGCARSPGRRNRRLSQEAADWFASSDTSWPFAFENICDALGLEPEWIRQLLRRREGAQPVRIPTIRRLAGTRHAVTGRAPGLGRAVRFAT
jgi:hypothetical protein